MSAPAKASSATSAAPARGPAAPAAAVKPSTTRVTILTGRRMTDLALPATAPIESYIDDTVSALADLLEDTPADVLAGFDFSAQGVWTFVRPGSTALRPDQSLDDAGVVDGSLLTLMPVSRTERYRPLVEDVIDAIAVLDESPQFDRAALRRFIGVAVPVGSLALTVLAALAWWTGGRHYPWPLSMGIGGAALLLASWLAVKVYKQAALSESLLIAAFPPVVAAASLAVPSPHGVAALGAPQLAGGAGAVLLLALVTRGGARRRAELAAFTVVTAMAVTAAAIGFGYGWQRWVPAGAILCGLFIVTNAAKLTVAVARIALPPIPAPGETVDLDELLDPIAGRDESDGDTQTWRAVIASVPDSAVRLTERSNLAKRLLIGFVTAGALILTVGAVAVVVRGHFFVHTLVVAGLVTVACAFRSRLYAEPWCAWAMLGVASAVPLGVTARLSLWYPQHAWLLLAGLLGAAVLALAIVAAAAGVRRISPVMKRVMELIDGAVVAAIIPMLLWISGVYDIIRNIRF